jgi:hypothetical protein
MISFETPPLWNFSGYRTSLEATPRDLELFSMKRTSPSHILRAWKNRRWRFHPALCCPKTSGVDLYWGARGDLSRSLIWWSTNSAAHEWCKWRDLRHRISGTAQPAQSLKSLSLQQACVCIHASYRLGGSFNPCCFHFAGHALTWSWQFEFILCNVYRSWSRPLLLR